MPWVARISCSGLSNDDLAESVLQLKTVWWRSRAAHGLGVPPNPRRVGQHPISPAGYPAYGDAPSPPHRLPS